MDGIAMMLSSALKASGIDVQKAVTDFETLKTGVEQTLLELKANYAEILAGQKRIENRMEEIWTANQTALRMSSQVRLLPQQVPPTQPPEQNEQQNAPQSQPQ